MSTIAADHTTVVLPILTLLLGQILGYWFAERGTVRRIAAERRAEYASQFVARAYRSLEYLTTREAAQGIPAGVTQELTVLGDQAGFFLSNEAATAIDELTSAFVVALNDRASPDRDLRRDVWKDYRAKLDAVRALLRRELKTGA